MSLLSNLLAFSSLSGSSQRQQRSSSANTKFLFETESEQKASESKHRVQSKSLSKMGLLSNLNQPKIDPKHRCLHRVAHNFSMKVRKHYYTFFVTMETMKKNNVTMNKSKKENQERQQAGLTKLCQIFSISFQKQYQNKFKQQCFKAIKLYSQKGQLIKTIQKICNQYQFKAFGQNFFNYLRQLQKIQMKLDVVKSTIDPIIKKYNDYQIRSFIQTCKAVKRQTKPKPKEISIFELFDNANKKNSQNTITIDDYKHQKIKTEPKLKKNQIINTPNYNLLQSLDNSFKLNESLKMDSRDEKQGERRKSFDYTLHQSESKYTTQENRMNSLQASPLQSYNIRSRSPYTACKKIPNLRESVVRESLQSKSYPKMYTSYQSVTNLNEQPFQLIAFPQKKSKLISRLKPQQLPYSEVEDLADKSNIFRDFKSSKISEFQNLQISNVVADSFNRIEGISNDMDKNKDRSEGYKQKSQLSYIPYLPHENSLSTINNKEESSFGCEAVNFKNSLVIQRESMKKTSRPNVEVSLKNKTLINSCDIDPQIYHTTLKSKGKYKLEPPTSKYEHEPSYGESDSSNQYNMKKDIGSLNMMRSTNIPNLQNSTYEWQMKRGYNQLQGETRTKSHSFANSMGNENYLRRSTQQTSENYQLKGAQLSYYPSHIGSLNSSMNMKGPQYWKNQLVDNRSQMPVRDVGLDPLAKHKLKASNAAISQPTKQQPYSHKKYINISKR